MSRIEWKRIVTEWKQMVTKGTCRNALKQEGAYENE